MENPAISQIATAMLLEHPNQQKIYGDTKISSDFVKSIVQRGILQPLLVTSSELFDKNDTKSYTIISGHRRKIGGGMANLDTVPCIIKEYPSPIFADLDHVFCNKQRVKNPTQITNEINDLKQLLCQYDNIKKHQDLSKTPEEVKQFFLEFQKRLDKYGGDPKNTAKLIAKELGITQFEVSQHFAISDDEKFDNYVDSLQKKGVPESDIKIIYKSWEANKKLFHKGEITLNNAYNFVLKLKKEVRQQLAKNSKAGAKHNGLHNPTKQQIPKIQKIIFENTNLLFEDNPDLETTNENWGKNEGCVVLFDEARNTKVKFEYDNIIKILTKIAGIT